MQADFSKALLDPQAPTPENLAEPVSFDKRARFNVYRNNVLSSLIEALLQSFPVVVTLIGEDAFAALAAQFVRAHPPRSPYLYEYGDQFAHYLSTRVELKAYPYIEEVAALEYAVSRSTHAADAVPITEAFAELAANPEALASARFRFAPSVELMHTGYASGSIWVAHQNSEINLQSVEVDKPEWLMLSRPGFLVELDWLEPAEFRFIKSLIEGKAVEQALNDSGANFDLSGCFHRLLVRQVLIGLEESE